MLFLKKPWKKYEKNRDIKLAAKEARRNSLVSQLNYHTKKFFIENLLATEMKQQRSL